MGKNIAINIHYNLSPEKNHWTETLSWVTIESLSLKANWLAVPFVVKLFRIVFAQGLLLLRPGLRLWERFLFAGPQGCNKGEQQN